MRKIVLVGLLLCLGVVLTPCGGNSTVHRGYIFTAPKRLLAGETENACLSLHNVKPPVHVVLELLSPSSVAEEEILTSTNTVLKTGVETCLELATPLTKYSNGRLRLKMIFDNHPDYVVEVEKDVYIEHDSLITFVETDKPVYKPGQDVNIRILMLKHDLKPWKNTIPKVWIENPSEIRVAQWANVSTEHGMAQLTFPLSSEPSPGTWKIKVEKKKSHPQVVHTTVFEVKKYVLPRFQVTISPPGYILADAENVTWNICAKYSYGKPVKGTLLLKSTPQTPSWRRKQNLPEIHYETELDSPDGCTEFVLSGAVLGLAHWKVAPNNIVLIANFTEAGTGIVETAISRTAVVHQALKLEFVPYSPKYFKLGLPYHGKVRVLKQDDSPAPNEKIQLCLRVRGKDEWLRVVVECRNFTSSTDGFVDFIVPPQHKNIVLLSFVATGIDYPTKYYSPDKRWRVFMDQPSAYFDVNPWYSPSDSYLAVARGNQPIVCGEKYSFNVMYTAPANNNTDEPISFHYSINSKGDLLIFGHVKHKPHRDTVLNYSEFRNLLGAVESPTNKTDQGYVVHRFPLSVKVTPSMAPVSELLLYYVRPDGETVATTYTVDVGHCFENKVKTAWHADSQRPGTATQFHVEAAPWSLCGISAVDKSTLFLAGSKTNLIDADKTFDQLKRFHPDPVNRPIWSWTHCKPTQRTESSTEEIDHLPVPAMEAPPAWDRRIRKRRTVVYHGGVNYVDAIQAFHEFGVVVMSDLILETRPCPQFFTGVHFLDLARLDRSQSGDVHMRHSDIDEPDRMFKMMPMAYPLLNFGGQELGYVDQLLDQTATLRSYFPETWLWELVPTGKEGKITIERELPHTITDWVGYTACISPKHGLGIAPPTTITAFQPFFLDYNLPYSVKRGELLRLKVSLFNYMHHSLPVRIKLEDATGLDLHLSHLTISFCVKSRDSVVHEYMLRPRVLGEVNITVSAEIDSDYVEPCGPETLIFTRDVIVKPILVQPEGFPVDVTTSAFICPKDFSDDSTISANLELPEDLVPDSARAYVTLVGDILGPALKNLENLVRLPMGCGEQNMILFVPNIHVINYLEATNVENSELRARAIKNMEKGYQRELNYRHPDGSYSAFGPDSSDSGSSMWLTAFVVKSFAQARSLVHIDERDLKMSVKWIVRKQLENGCFPVIGRVFHKEMKGGLQEDDSSSPALTAYILVSLLESGVPLTASLINNALYCLEKGMTNSHDSPYTLALSTYALALLEHPKANGSMKLLMDRATKHKDLLWWEDKAKPSTGLSIEMTAYAVLSLVKLGGEENMVEALKAVRWMSKQRNAEGGFTSTQDTVLGLEALTKYAIGMSTNSTDLAILVTATDIDQVHRMHNDNRMVVTQIQLPVVPTIVDIFADGEGCVLVQTNLKYNVASATGSEAFDLTVSAESIAYVEECSMQKITICARYKMADEESNMALLEVGMVSGYVPDRSSLHTLLEEPTTKVKRFEEDRDIVSIYFDKLTAEKTCISFTVNRENIVDRLEPANVKLYDYYQQELTISANYSFAEICSSADIAEQDPIPNPMTVELKLVKDSVTERTIPEKPKENAENVEATERSAKNVGKDSTSAKNRVADSSEENSAEWTDRFQNRLVLEMRQMKNKMALKRRQMRNRMKFVERTQDTEGQPRTENKKVEKETVGQTDDLQTAENGRPIKDVVQVPVDAASQVDTGSGVEPAERDFNPAFVNVDHDLETPEGVEGPPPVYVKPDDVEQKTSIVPATLGSSVDSVERKSTVTDVPSWTVTSTTIGQKKNKHGEPRDNESQTKLETSTTSPADDEVYTQLTPIEHDERCPICADDLPANVTDIYCSAKNIIKLAVRHLRRARLLRDLSSKWKRLRTTVQFKLVGNCTCSPLDNPGSWAFLINSSKRDFAKVQDNSMQILDRTIAIYGAPSGTIARAFQKITEIRSNCSMQEEYRSPCIEHPADG